MLPLPAKGSKTSLVNDARAFNECCRNIYLKMNAVPNVADVANKIIFMEVLIDRSGLNNEFAATVLTLLG